MTDEMNEITEEPTTAPHDWQPEGGWPSASGWGRPTAPGWSVPPSGPTIPPAASGGGGGWSYGYGAGSWGPPPEPPRQPDAARRVLAAIVIIGLVLVSGAVGAVISAAVHDQSTSTPFRTTQLTPSGGDSRTNAIAAKVNPAVVNIYTTINSNLGKGQAAGTGMIITSSGEVLTNNHVIADANTVRVQLVSNGDIHSAKVVGYDVTDDVALIRIDNVSGLPTVSIGDASNVAAGDAVVAIGNAGGRGGTPTVTSGSVTALDQQVTAGDVGANSSEVLRGMIQISAPIEQGDSGGPLVDTNGRVIGMNTAAATADRFFDQAGSSTAFAIPIDRAIRIVHQIEAGNQSGNVHVGDRALMGIQVQNIGTQSGPTPPVDSGALVSGVQSGSPADSAGLATGDVIVSLGTKTITSATGLTAVMSPYHPKDTVDVGWVDQSGQTHHASLKLISGPPA